MITTKSRLVTSRVGWLLVAIGLAIGIAAGFPLVSSIGPALKDTFLTDACATPCSEVRDLDEGRYLIFERTGDSNSIGPVTTTQRSATTITPADVVVTSPAGGTVEVTQSNGSETINRNGAIYTGVVSFHVPASGRYRVSVDAPSDTHVLVAPGIGQLFAKALPGAGVAVLGFAAGTTGIVILIVAWSRRRNAAKVTEGPTA